MEQYPSSSFYHFGRCRTTFVPFDAPLSCNIALRNIKNFEYDEKVILTGDRPTGKLHIGHYVGSLRRRVELQNTGEYDQIFIMIADAQALTDNADNPEKIRQNVIEVALDYLSDSAKELKQKVNSMYTDPEHIHIEQSGHLEGNAVFTYHDAFCQDSDFEKFLPGYNNLQQLKDHYTRGGLGDGTCKKFLLNILNDRLEPMRQRRHEYEQNIPAVYEILRRGTEEARKVAAQSISEVRHAMRIDYFDDEELIAEQSRRYAVN